MTEDESKLHCQPHPIVELPFFPQDNLYITHVMWYFLTYKLSKGICVNLYEEY